MAKNTKKRLPKHRSDLRTTETISETSTETISKTNNESTTKFQQTKRIPNANLLKGKQNNAAWKEKTFLKISF